MNEQDFRLLTILKETRNITHAAGKLYMNQSSVSKRIIQLEKELGVTLLVRSRQGISFTPAGEILLHHIQKVMLELYAMRQALKDNANTVTGTLRAGASTNYTRYHLPDQLAAYSKAFPSVNIRLVTADSPKLFNMLMEGEIDVGIIRGEYDSWRGEKILLARERICLITNAENAEKSLNEFPSITWQSNQDIRHLITQWMRENNVVAHKNLITVESTANCLNMVEHGLGWGIVPEMCLANFHGSITPLFFADGEPLIRSTYIMYQKQASELPQVRAFVEMIRADVQNTFAEGSSYHV